MKKELRLFMNKTDEDSFMDCFLSAFPEVIKKSEYQWRFNFVDEYIQFLRSERVPAGVIIGRMAIVTKNKCDNAKKAEAVFRKIDKWVKNNYSNDVYGRNVNIEGSLSRVKNIWIGPALMAECSKGNIKLKQSKKGLVEYIWRL